jgi:hypothetical protein
MKHIFFILSAIVMFSSCCSQDTNQAKGYVISQTEERETLETPLFAIPEVFANSIEETISESSNEATE